VDRKHERRAQVFAVALLAFMFVPACARAAGQVDDGVLAEYDSKIRRKSTVLDSIRGELERGRSRLEELATQEGTYLEQLALLEKNMETARSYLEELGGRIDEVAGHIEQLRDSLSQATDALHERQRTMRQRLRMMYKTGRLAEMQMLLTSANLADVLRRVKYFQRLKDYDQALVRTIDSTRAVIRAQTETLEEERGQLVALKEVKEAEQGELERERRQRGDMLREVRGEKEAYEQMVQELERAQEELTALLKTLQKRRTEARIDYEMGRKIAFERRKGVLPWPVDGPVVKGFGKIVHPVYKTITMSTGVDIAAPKGSKVLCVAPGRVDYVGWMRGYGKFVIVNHYGGYATIYAHLDEIAVRAGGEVQYGTVLGVVGDTGSLTGAKLHFQVRKEAVPMNPSLWLELRE
jgi:septal ring factor EnvC (AmiA/AmiB activator)